SSKQMPTKVAATIAREEAEAIEPDALCRVNIFQGEPDRLVGQRRLGDAFAAPAPGIGGQLAFQHLLWNRRRSRRSSMKPQWEPRVSGSGKGAALPPLPPLRTALAPFDAYGSSIGQRT